MSEESIPGYNLKKTFKKLFIEEYLNPNCIHILNNERNTNISEKLSSGESFEHSQVLCFMLKNDYGIENLVKEENLTLKYPLESDDLLIDVHYVGLNFSDVYGLKGVFFKKPLPYIPGIECSGRVLATGSNFKTFKKDDAVVVFKPEGGLLAEKVVVNSKYVFSIDDLEKGAAIPTNYLTALEIILSIRQLIKYFSIYNINKAFKDSITVLFHGCSGGVASAFYDLTKHLPVKHLGTCSPSKHQRVKYESYDYSNWQQKIKSKYKDGVDVVVETISGPNTVKSLDVLKQKGQLIIIGATSALDENPRLEEGAFVSVEKLIMKNISVTGINIQTLFENHPEHIFKSMMFLKSLYGSSLIEPFIGATFHINMALDAIKYLMNRKNVGKVLIKMKNDP